MTWVEQLQGRLQLLPAAAASTAVGQLGAAWLTTVTGGLGAGMTSSWPGVEAEPASGQAPPSGSVKLEKALYHQPHG